MVVSFIKLLAILGIPVFLVTWYLFRRLYQRGELTSGADYTAIKSHLKDIKKQKSGRDNLLHKKWMKFGGGFYGVTAVTTWVWIELVDLWGLIVDFPGFAAIFGDGVIGFLVGMLVNQFQNFLQALLWFAYWGEGGGSIFMIIAIAYCSYLLGVRAGERTVQEWLDRFKPV
jgi:hypothetical protein